jgi:hypothetical protein
MKLEKFAYFGKSMGITSIRKECKSSKSILLTLYIKLNLSAAGNFEIFNGGLG